MNEMDILQESWCPINLIIKFSFRGIKIGTWRNILFAGKVIFLMCKFFLNLSG